MLLWTGFALLLTRTTSPRLPGPSIYPAIGLDPHCQVTTLLHRQRMLAHATPTLLDIHVTA